jgi:hypothetical protein
MQLRLTFLGSKIAIYLIKSKLQEKPSALKKEHPALQQKIKFINYFLCLRVIFALLDPDKDPGPH